MHNAIKKFGNPKMRRWLISLALVLCAVTEPAWGSITSRTNPGSGAGCSNNSSQGTSLVINTQGAVAGDFVAVWVTNVNGFLVTVASVSGTTATVTFTANSDTPPASGQHARISGMSTAGYNIDDVVLTGSSSTTVQYTVSGALASCSTAATCSSNSNGAISTVASITDNATTPNTYSEVRGAFGVDTVGALDAPAATLLFFTNNFVLATGSTQPQLTLHGGNNTFLALCAMAFSGVSSTVDATGTLFYPGSQTSVPTPSIAGNVQPELIISNSYTSGGGAGNTHSACGGHAAFTAINPTSGGDDNNGSPAGFFITSGTGTFCDGLTAALSTDAFVSITSFKGTGATGATPTINKKSKLAKLLDE
jgi:hypothetical protein